MAPKAVLPVHAADRGPSSSWARSAACVSRPRNLLITLAVVFVLLFVFASSGPEHRYAGPGSGLLNDIPYLGRPNNGGAGSGSGTGGVHYDHSEFEPEYQSAGDGIWGERAREVRDGFLHAYGAYSKVAFGRDEIRPVNNVAVDNFNGWGVTIVDSIDTMVLMGLKNEYEHALAFVAKLNMTESRQSVHFFETVIRYLGGFLSAYHLAKEPIFLKKADDLGRILLPAFNTKSGLPQYSAATQPDMHPDQRNSMFLAEIGSCQLEFKYLAHLTGNAQYWTRADAVTRILHKAQPNSGVKGLWGTNWYIDSGDQQGGHYTIGALSDSAYEYLLKQYLLSGRSEKYLLDMYIQATDVMVKHSLHLSACEPLFVFGCFCPGWRTTGSGKVVYLRCFLLDLCALRVDHLPQRRRQCQPWPRTLRPLQDRARAPVVNHLLGCARARDLSYPLPHTDEHVVVCLLPYVRVLHSSKLLQVYPLQLHPSWCLSPSASGHLPHLRPSWIHYRAKPPILPSQTMAPASCTNLVVTIVRLLLLSTGRVCAHWMFSWSPSRLIA